MVNRTHLHRWILQRGQKAVKLLLLDMGRGEALIQEAQRRGDGFELREPRRILGYREVRRYFIGHLGVLPPAWEPTEAGVPLVERRSARNYLKEQTMNLRWCARILGVEAVTAAASEPAEKGKGGRRGQ